MTAGEILSPGKRKGIGYILEAIAAMATIFIFVVGNTSSPPVQDWSQYQKKTTASDLGYTLKQTGDLEEMIRRREIGSLETSFEELGNLEVRGTLSDIPVDQQSIGYHVVPGKRNTENPSTVTAGDKCDGDLEEIESEEPIKKTGEKHNAVVYLADTDPDISGGGNGEEDYDSLWVDNGTRCQFSAAEGPFYIDEFFKWGNSTDPSTFEYYEFKNISEDGNEFRYFRATDMIELRNTVNGRLNGIETSQSFDAFAYSEKDISAYDSVIFPERDSLNQIEDNPGKLKDFLRSGTVLFLANFHETDIERGFINETGLEWVGIDAGSTSTRTTCKTYGDVRIDSDCTYGPGTYHLESLTVESGVTVNIENMPERCNTEYRGPGCSSVSYSRYAPKIAVEGDAEINGEISADNEGFQNASSSADRGGPGAGEEGPTAGGGAYGGDGGDSDGGTPGGNGYGDASVAKRLGSAGGYDTDGIKGGSGGGSVWILSNETVILDGGIYSRGEDAGAGAGGGSGGSIRLEADRFSGSGTINVNGGDSSNRGGGGSGGRVVLRRQEGSVPFSVSRSGGTSGGGGQQGEQGSLETLKENFNIHVGPDESIDFVNTENSDRIETYFTGLEGKKSNVRLPPDKVVSNSSGTVMSDELMLKSSGVEYFTDSWNATNYTMDPVKPGQIGSEVLEYPDSECVDPNQASQNLTIGVFEFPEGKELKVLNTEMGDTRDFCKNHEVRSLSVDIDGDGDFTETGEGPLLNGEITEIDNKNYQIRTLTKTENRKKGEGAELVFTGGDSLPIIKHRQSFQGFSGTRMALIPYQEEYSEDERKMVAVTLYWLLGDQESFGEEDTTSFSTEISGSVRQETYMPYDLALRWK